jgi:3-oxoadipate enol-lactonase
MPALSQDWRVVRADHPGHGTSPVWDGSVTVADIGKAVLELLDDLGTERFSFCGLSLGGAVGQWIAAHASDRVARLVLCATAAHFTPPEVYLERAATVRTQGMQTVASSVMKRWFTPEFREREPGTVDRFRAMVAAIAPEGYAQCCEAVANFDGRPDLARISAPTLIIVGAEDPATPLERARVLQEGIAGSTLTVIQQAAHLVNVEQPEAVGIAICTHLREGGNQ